MWNSAHWSGSFSFWSLCHVTRYLFQHPSKKSPCLTGMAKCTNENGCCSFSYTVSRHQPVLWKQANKCLELQGREKDVIVTEQYLRTISVKIIYGPFWYCLLDWWSVLSKCSMRMFGGIQNLIRNWVKVQANKCLELQGREKDVIVTEQYLRTISVKIIYGPFWNCLLDWWSILSKSIMRMFGGIQNLIRNWVKVETSKQLYKQHSLHFRMPDFKHSWTSCFFWKIMSSRV